MLFSTKGLSLGGNFLAAEFGKDGSVWKKSSSRLSSSTLDVLANFHKNSFLILLVGRRFQPSPTPKGERKEMRRFVSDLIFLLVVIALILGGFYLYRKYNDMSVGDIYDNFIQGIIKDTEAGTILEDHPFVKDTTLEEDYRFAVKQMRDFNVTLSETDKYLFDSIYNGSLEFVYTGAVERDAGKFYIYGDGQVYRVYCGPAEVCAMPILSSIVFNAYQGSSFLKTKVCKNAWDIYWAAGLSDGFEYDLYGKLS